MISRWIKFWMMAAMALLCLPVSARAQGSCAYAAVNGSCTLTLDRLNPVAPPTIFVRRGGLVKILVKHPLPFEHLTIDEKSAAIQLAPDQFKNGFADITAALGGLAIINGPAPAIAPGGPPGAPAAPPPPPPVVCPVHPATLAEFKQCQSDIAKPLGDALKVGSIDDPADPPLNFGTWVYSRLCSIHNLFMPLQSAALTPQSQILVCRDLPAGITPLNVPKDGGELDVWETQFDAHNDVLTSTKVLLDGTPGLHLPGLNDKIAGLDADLAGAKKIGTITAGDYVTLNAGQQVLHGGADTAGSYLTKMQGLLVAVRALKSDSEPSEFTKIITDQDAIDPDGKKEKNYEVQTWDLNAGNRLAGIAGEVKADKSGDEISRLIGSLADAPTKQTVVEFKIEFLNESRMEISSGLLVPFRPYHSFSEATPYSSATSTTGSCTAGTTTAPSAPANCPIVQQSLTAAIVPAVSFNILLGHGLVLGKQRGAWMWTVAAGYNSATTSAAFGTGLSFAYRSMVFSIVTLADRDQHLTGGYQVNQPAGTATAPTTENSWRVNPSFGISLRVPLGGGSQ